MGVKEASPEKLGSQAWKKLEERVLHWRNQQVQRPWESLLQTESWSSGLGRWLWLQGEAGPGGWGRRGLEAEIDELAVIRLFCLLGGSLGVCPRSWLSEAIIEYRLKRMVTGDQKWVAIRGSFRDKNWKDLPVLWILWRLTGKIPRRQSQRHLGNLEADSHASALCRHDAPYPSVCCCLTLDKCGILVHSRWRKRPWGPLCRPGAGLYPMGQERARGQWQRHQWIIGQGSYTKGPGATYHLVWQTVGQDMRAIFGT